MKVQCSAPAVRLLDARPAWLPTVAALCCAALTAMLGQWQWHKAELKTALRAGYDRSASLPVLAWGEVAKLGEAARYRKVRLTGEFAAAYQILLDNKVLHGRAGYHAVAPMRLADGGAVLVDRGWLAASGERSQLPGVAVPAGRRIVEGILVHAQGRYLELAAGGETGRVWQNLDLDRYRAWFGGDLPDWLVLQTDPARDGLVRDWPVPDLGVARHRSYAVQWYSMSSLSVGLWLYFVVLKRGRAR